ncbi:MAG: SRPBCC family protein [Actinobacteria bacterium]|nr:MAG: SRPBCC family protein [Actinomycetota bacterium]
MGVARSRPEATMEAKAYGRDRRVWTFAGRSRARPEQVYDVLADLGSHLEWAGNRQFRSFRLLSLDAPGGPAEPGTRFTSTGRIPMNRARFDNRNTISKADRPRLFEITTESTIAWPKRAHGEGTFVNTFEISPDGKGSRVVYRSEQLRFREPPWGLRYPLLRSVTYRIWIPIWSRRGFRNLLRMAEERSTATSPGSSVPMK